MTSLDKAIRDLIDESDIASHSNVYEEVVHELTDIGLNLAFFVFETSERSSCARTLNGNTVTCPVLELYLKYDRDFRETGIDRHQGNWDDKWVRTRTVRDAFNTVLSRHGYGEGFVSGHTFVFVRTLEELVFHHIGRECKNAVRQLICAEAPGVEIAHVFWNGAQYDVIMRDKADYKRVKRKVKSKVAKALPKLLAKADKGGHCQAYNVTIEFGHTGMNFLPLMRNDY